MILAQLRREIDEIDGEIIRLIGRRLMVAREIGEVKYKLNIPVVNHDREEEVLVRWVRELGKMGIEASSAFKIAKSIIEATTKVQVKPRPNLKILIVGSGRVGKILNDILSTVAAVEVSDMKPTDVEGFNMVIMATKPSDEALNYIRGISGRLRGRVLMDVFSVKSSVFKVIEEESLRGGFSYISIHPLFGNIPDPWGETIIVIPSRTGLGHLQAVVGMFEEAGLRPIVLESPEEHDRLMAYVQASHHIALLALYLLLRRVGVGPQSPLLTYSLKHTMRAIERALEQIDVVEEIQLKNPYSPMARRDLEEALREVYRLIEEGRLREVAEV